MEILQMKRLNWKKNYKLDNMLHKRNPSIGKSPGDNNKKETSFSEY